MRCAGEVQSIPFGWEKNADGLRGHVVRTRFLLLLIVSRGQSAKPDEIAIGSVVRQR